MPKISIENMTPEQQLVIEVLINEGKLQAYEELLEHFRKEYHSVGSEDPYYGYYVKYVIEELEKRYSPLAEAVK